MKDGFQWYNDSYALCGIQLQYDSHIHNGFQGLLGSYESYGLQDKSDSPCFVNNTGILSYNCLMQRFGQLVKSYQ